MRTGLVESEANFQAILRRCPLLLSSSCVFQSPNAGISSPSCRPQDHSLIRAIEPYAWLVLTADTFTAFLSDRHLCRCISSLALFPRWSCAPLLSFTPRFRSLYLGSAVYSLSNSVVRCPLCLHHDCYCHGRCLLTDVV
jgi:hypothetical protein